MSFSVSEMMGKWQLYKQARTQSFRYGCRVTCLLSELQCDFQDPSTPAFLSVQQALAHSAMTAGVVNCRWMVMHARVGGGRGCGEARQPLPTLQSAGGPGPRCSQRRLWLGSGKPLPSLPVSASVKQNASAVGHLQLMSP